MVRMSIWEYVGIIVSGQNNVTNYMKHFQDFDEATRNLFLPPKYDTTTKCSVWDSIRLRNHMMMMMNQQRNGSCGNDHDRGSRNGGARRTGKNKSFPNTCIRRQSRVCANKHSNEVVYDDDSSCIAKAEESNSSFSGGFSKCSGRTFECNYSASGTCIEGKKRPFQKTEERMKMLCEADKDGNTTTNDSTDHSKDISTMSDSEDEIIREILLRYGKSPVPLRPQDTSIPKEISITISSENKASLSVRSLPL